MLPHLASCLGATPAREHETITRAVKWALASTQMVKKTMTTLWNTHTLIYLVVRIYIFVHLIKRLCIVLCPPLWRRNVNEQVFTAQELVSVPSGQRPLRIDISASVWCHITISASWLAADGKYCCKAPSYLLLGLTSPHIKQRKNWITSFVRVTRHWVILMQCMFMVIYNAY
jgi:hypothetical protein